MEQIRQALFRIAVNLEGIIHGSSVYKTFKDKADALRLVVRHENVQIKVELSPVLRGTVFEPELRYVSENVGDRFASVEVPIASMEDLYGSKIYKKGRC